MATNETLKPKLDSDPAWFAAAPVVGALAVLREHEHFDQHDDLHYVAKLLIDAQTKIEALAELIDEYTTHCARATIEGRGHE